jgi:hypothetical protein
MEGGKNMRVLCVFAIAGALLGLYGCATVANPLPAFIYSDVKGPINAHGSFDATKTGEACAQSYLGWVSVGDASIDAAKAAGGIKEVSTIDYKSTSVLAVYASFCTIVKGR